ncbi:MAG: PKD domain-containing protein [Bacteroidia bacterium]|nr:PKD domain-containing protein [Bacteroidia bacterium]
MKKIYFALVLIFIATASFAYNFTVTGIVTDQSNLPVANQTVVIMPADSMNTSLPTVNALTGTDGVFAATLTFQGNEVHAYIVYTYSICSDGTYQYYNQNIMTSGASVTVSFVICNNNPVTTCQASFTWDTNTPIMCGALGTGYNFYSTSTSTGNITNYVWMINGQAFPTENVTTCLLPGINNVCLVIYTDNNCTDSTCQSIIVGDSTNTGCQAAYTYTITNNVVHFLDASTGTPTTWTWSFGDGTSSDSPNPEHTYSTSGTYSVCLSIVTASGCSNYYCQTIQIGGSDCNAAFHFEMDPNDCPTCVHFINTSVPSGQFTSTWYFGNNIISAETSPVHQFPEPGTYGVCLTITSANGCTSTACDTVIVGGGTNGCQASFEVVLDGTTFNYHFTNTSTPQNNTFVCLWNFGDSTTSDAQNPTHEFAVAGLYTVCLTITTADGSCSNVSCQTINVGATGNYSVTGNVLAGDSLINGGIVVLMGNDGSMYSANISATGHFELHNIPGGTYILYAIPSYISYPLYAPTYYEHALYWMDATQINLTANLSDANIHLVGFNSPIAGTGGINGSVIWYNSKSMPVYKNLLNHSVAGITILLLDQYNNLVEFLPTDAGGNFSFSNLPFGTYKVYPEIAGYSTYSSTFVLNESNTTVSGLTVIINGTTITVGIDEVTPGGFGISASPNPVKETLNLNITGNGSSLSLSILNITGQVVYRENMLNLPTSDQKQIDVSKLPVGLYFVKAEFENAAPVIIRFVK